MIRYTKEEREQRAAVRTMEDGKRREAASQRSRPPRPTAKGQRQPRVRDHGYLAWLRRAPCLAGLIEGGCQGPVQACHLRMSIPAAPTPGSPTSRTTHTPGRDASIITSRTSTAASETAFFQRLGVDPFDLCRSLYAAFNEGEEPAAALVGYLVETGVL